MSTLVTYRQHTIERVQERPPIYHTVCQVCGKSVYRHITLADTKYDVRTHALTHHRNKEKLT